MNGHINNNNNNNIFEDANVTTGDLQKGTSNIREMKFHSAFHFRVPSPTSPKTATWVKRKNKQLHSKVLFNSFLMRVNKDN